jgi:hypothetical protein
MVAGISISNQESSVDSHSHSILQKNIRNIKWKDSLFNQRKKENRYSSSKHPVSLRRRIHVRTRFSRAQETVAFLA